jgi:hypothetical protein
VPGGSPLLSSSLSGLASYHLASEAGSAQSQGEHPYVPLSLESGQHPANPVSKTTADVSSPSHP